MAKKPIAFKREKVAGAGPPPGPWIWISAELLTSDAWLGQSICCRRLIDLLLRDHMSHGGLANGELIATFDQMVAVGCSRRLITPAIEEALARGLIAYRNAYRDGTQRHPRSISPDLLWTRGKEQLGLARSGAPRRTNGTDIASLKFIS